MKTEILVTYVVHPFRPRHGTARLDPEELDRREQRVRHDRNAAGQAFLDQVVDSIRKRLGHVTAVVREGDPAEQILALAAERRADLIIAGARGVSQLERLLVGSVADRLLKHAPCSVMIVR